MITVSGGTTRNVSCFKKINPKVDLRLRERSKISDEEITIPCENPKEQPTRQDIKEDTKVEVTYNQITSKPRESPIRRSTRQTRRPEKLKDYVP